MSFQDQVKLPDLPLLSTKQRQEAHIPRGGARVAGARVAVVMPAYNEAEGLEDFLREIEEHLAPQTESLVFVIVDDGSDPPLTISHDMLAYSASSVDVIVNRENLGHGPSVLRAYRRGLTHRPDIVIHVDGDGQFFGKDFIPLLRAAEQGAVVHGVRHSRTDPWYRRSISGALRAVIGSRTRVEDVNTPLRAYPAGTIGTLLPLVPSNAVVPHIHLTLWENWQGLRTRNIPVSHRVRGGATTTGTTWQGSHGKLSVLPPWRLITFCKAAAIEVAGVYVRRHARRWARTSLPDRGVSGSGRWAA